MDSLEQNVNVKNYLGALAIRMGQPGDRYWIFLFILFLLILFSPFVSGITFGFLFMFAILWTVSTLTANDPFLTNTLRILSAPILITLLFSIIARDWVISLFDQHPWLDYLIQLLAIVLILLCGFLILISLTSTKTIRISDMAGMASLYLLIGFLWSRIYTTLESYVPGSFTISTSFDPFMVDGFGYSSLDNKMLYFSFVTLLTVGYGDITPANSVASALVVAEALIGQLFIIFVVASIFRKLR